MDTQVSYARLKATIRQRNVLAVAALGLTLAVLVQTSLVASRETRVILTPTLMTDTSLSSKSPGADYLEQTTRDVANLFLNRHPNNLSYFRTSVLRLAHPSTHGEIEAALMETERRLIATKTSTVFFPSEIFVDPENLYSEIRGELQTYLGSSRVEAKQVVYAAEWRFAAMRLWLQDFYPIDAGDTKAGETPLARLTSEAAQ